MRSKLIEYINNNYSFRDEYERLLGKPCPHGKCYCLWHPNHDTPAAKVYDNSMYCYVCKRQYGVYDLWKLYDPEAIERVKSTIILPEVSAQSKAPLRICNIDRTQSVNDIIKQILK